MSSPTRHDASKVLMGSVGSSDRGIAVEASDPASFPAGRAVRRASSGALSLASTDGELIGISAGRSLSDTAKTAVVREGNQVPVELSGFAYLVKADLTFYSKVSAAVAIKFLDTVSAGSEAASVTGDSVAGYVISLAMEDGTSTGTQCKAALDASPSVAALIDTVVTGTAGSAQASFVQDDIDGVIPVIGAAVHVSNSTGKAIPSGGSTTGACYASGVLTGIAEDASLIPAAKIDMGGGL
jgi:hypothetical protein